MYLKKVRFAKNIAERDKLDFNLPISYDYLANAVIKNEAEGLEWRITNGELNKDIDWEDIDSGYTLEFDVKIKDTKNIITFTMANLERVYWMIRALPKSVSRMENGEYALKGGGFCIFDSGEQAEGKARYSVWEKPYEMFDIIAADVFVSKVYEEENNNKDKLENDVVNKKQAKKYPRGLFGKRPKLADTFLTDAQTSALLNDVTLPVDFSCAGGFVIENKNGDRVELLDINETAIVIKGSYREFAKEHGPEKYVPKKLYERGWHKFSFFVIPDENPNIRIWLDVIGLDRLFWGASSKGEYTKRKDIVNGTLNILISGQGVWTESSISEDSEGAFIVYGDEIRIRCVE